MKSLDKRRRKKSRFARFLVVYSAVLAVIIVSVWCFLYAFIGGYEESRPAGTMDEIIKKLSCNDIAGVLSEMSVEVNEFENDTDMLVSYLSDAICDTELRYAKKSGEYSESTPVYVIYADNTPVAKISLEIKRINSFNFPIWKAGSIYIGNDLGLKKSSDISICVPKNSIVTINGVPVSDIYISQDDVEFEPCKNIGEFVEKPLKTVYTVGNLMMQPTVEVSCDGKILEVEEKDGVYEAAYPDDEELLEQMKGSITELDRAYGKYIINKGKLSAVTSSMVGNAREYMSDIPAVWAFLYGKEYTYEFQNEQISNFRSYSNDCFSCDVYYDLYVQWNNGSVTYNTSLTYTYVYYDNRWVVADFAIK